MFHKSVKKNVISPAIGWSSLKMSITCGWLMVLLSLTLFLLISCLPDLSVSEWGALESPALMKQPSIPPCSSIRFCLMQFDASVVRRIHIKNYVFLEHGPFLSFMRCPLSLLTLKSALSEINIVTPASFSLVLACYVFLHPFTFNVCVFILKMCAVCLFCRQQKLG